jgi:organic radical activating enzyme
LVNGVVDLVRKHKPMHVSLVGGEPMVRHRELSRILPQLSAMGVFTLVVTSGVIPVPPEWMSISRLRVAISVDGLPEHHDIRRKPATYEKILKNIAGREVNVHWVITRPMLERAGYLEEYIAFWSAREEVNRIWVSVYTPQIGEQSAEMLAATDRETVARELPGLAVRYPKHSPRRVPTIACLQRCLQIIQPTSPAASSRAFSAGPRTARNAAARRAWACTGCAVSKWRED